WRAPPNKTRGISPVNGKKPVAGPAGFFSSGASTLDTPEPDMTLARAALLVGLVFALAALASGCSGSGDSSSAATATATVTVTTTDTVAGASSGGPADSLQREFVRVVADVSPSVVQIETSQGLGSGVVYDGMGDIVTNAHVVGAAKSVKVTLSNGSR